MTIIDPRSTLAVTLREQIAALRVRSHPPANASSAIGSPPRQAAEMLSVLAQRIRGLDPTDPERGTKAVRLFLEGELVKEFGDALLNDASFPELVDAVQKQMRDDREMAAAVDTLGAWLLERHAG